MQKKSMGWGWIVFWLIIFWPVGLFFVVRKLSTDKSALMSGKTTSVSVVGWILIVFGAMGLFSSTSGTDPVGGMIVALVFIAGGVLLLRKASTTKKTAAKYKKYIDIVVNQNVRSIDNVAAAVALPYEVVVKDLQDMIDIGYLANAFIHQGNREISLQEHAAPTQVNVPTQGQAPVQTKAVRCPGCGANNVVVVGQVTECEYCGNPINA